MSLLGFAHRRRVTPEAEILTGRVPRQEPAAV
jgi:hypothetical protein